MSASNHQYVYLCRGDPIGFTDSDGLCRRGFKPMDGNPGACAPDDRVDPERCVTAECAAGIGNPSSADRCATNCQVKYQLICTGAAVGTGLATKNVLAGTAVEVGCFLVKAIVCERSCCK